jgi:predicted transcriptional regulator YdeE
MEKYQLKNNITVFGFEVKTFPDGVSEAFDKLVNNVPGGFARDFYGISFRDSENKMVYLATALEKEHGEAEKYEYERYTIKKGEYVTETVWDWRKKTDLIKHIFKGLFNSIQGTTTGPCIEWYKDNNEMLCMVRLAQTQ